MSEKWQSPWMKYISDTPNYGTDTADTVNNVSNVSAKVEDSENISGPSPVTEQIFERLHNNGELPASISRWDALPRYLLEEFARTGLLDRATAESVVRIAWFNSTAAGQPRREFKA